MARKATRTGKPRTQSKRRKTPSKVVRRSTRSSAAKSGGRGKRASHVQGKRSTDRIDPTLLLLLGTILVFGLITLASASSVDSYNTFDGDSYYLLKKQLIQGVFLGGLAFYVMSKIDYHYWRANAFPLVVATLVLLFAVFLPGIGVEQLGARRWIGVAGFTFQPSEVVKLTFAIYLAAWLEKRGREVEDVHYGFMPFMIMLGVLVLLIAIAQKDLGTTIVIATISIVVYFVGGAPWRHLAAIMAGGLASVYALIKLEPYRFARLTTFLHPELDPQGTGYHINQALLAVGSGGFFGLGLGRSRQKFAYLPEVASDSIFAIIAEELGFVVAAAVVLLFLAFTIKAFRIAMGAPDQFGKLLAVGIATWIGFQAFVNIGAMLSILPLTGITLPFISYGSTSMIAALAATGVLANISRYSSK